MQHVIFPFLAALFLYSCIKPAISAEKAMPVQKPNDCMARVIVLDDSLGKARNRACQTVSLSETIRQYADGMEKISYRGCPSDFTEAFRKHREAWLALIPVTDQYPGLRGEMHVLFKQLESGEHAERFKPLVETVWDTWAEVEAAMKR
ncbi:MAG: hypothetical protein IPJ82_16920 [Lewinellaceae bacterium]|nr:hypothetical protein [Lewinellaceae bacterium]